jgi:hypothetical protein
VNPKYAPITPFNTVKIKPIALITIPAIAKFRLEEPVLIMPRINPMTEIGNPQIGNNHARRLKIPNASEVIASP